jgi:hypothetical protein
MIRMNFLIIDARNNLLGTPAGPAVFVSRV